MKFVDDDDDDDRQADERATIYSISQHLRFSVRWLDDELSVAE